MRVKVNVNEESSSEEEDEQRRYSEGKEWEMTAKSGDDGKDSRREG